MIGSISSQVRNWRTISEAASIEPEERVCEGLDRLREKSIVIGSAALKQMWDNNVEIPEGSVLLHDAHVEKYESSGVAAHDRLLELGRSTYHKITYI